MLESAPVQPFSLDVPENVLLDAAIPKIADFGLAGSSRMKPVTQSIDVRGTPAYMSPEHFFDFKKADQHSDIYSLGKILLDRIIQKATAEKKEKRLVTESEWNYLFSKQSLSDITALADKTDSPPAKTQHVPADSDLSLN